MAAQRREQRGPPRLERLRQEQDVARAPCRERTRHHDPSPDQCSLSGCLKSGWECGWPELASAMELPRRAIGGVYDDPDPVALVRDPVNVLRYVRCAQED